MEKLKVAVIGVGHLGKEHARLCSVLPEVELVGVVDINKEQGLSVANACNTQYFDDYKKVIGVVDAVNVVVPTKSHFKVAMDCLQNGIHVLIEKPMTGTVAEAKELIRISEQKNVTLQPGYVERFNPAIIAIQKYNIVPKFIECHRLSPFTFRSDDIGVVMDLMVHDIDIILSLCKSKIKKIDAVGINVISDKEDIANARIVFENNCVANVTASRVSLKTMRKIRLFSEDMYISLDYQKHDAVIFRKSPKLNAKSINISNEVSTIADLKNYSFGDLLQREEVKMDNTDEPLRKELESFFRCVLNKEEQVVSAKDGLNALESAEYVLAEIKASLHKK
ncbi:MAG: Gfo/Idh/MocA family oxidoreductase [Candidatus Anammoxibacter sp.]